MQCIQKEAQKFLCILLWAAAVHAMLAREGRFQFTGCDASRRTTPHIFDEFCEFGDDSRVFRWGRPNVYLCLQVARQFFGVTQALDNRIHEASVSNVPQTAGAFSVIIGNGTGRQRFGEWVRIGLGAAAGDSRRCWRQSIADCIAAQLKHKRKGILQN